MKYKIKVFSKKKNAFMHVSVGQGSHRSLQDPKVVYTYVSLCLAIRGLPDTEMGWWKATGISFGNDFS